jgi:nucleotide sugar dehydrogenase|tara:strand:- start:3713 stop:5458 length:1746 start_codon:yes stop_codon:yes gene_type:complete
MMKDISKLLVVVRPEETLDAAFRRMSHESKEVLHPGVAAIINNNEELLGIITDGDLRRAYARDVSFDSTVSEEMISKPVVLPASMSKDEIVREVHKRVKKSGNEKLGWLRHILLVDELGRLTDVQDFFELLLNQGSVEKDVAIFGMGYVGLTLAVSLATRGHQVIGLDISSDLIKNLRSGEPHIHEPGLREMLRAVLNRKKIDFYSDLKDLQPNVFIIAVGTPLDKNSEPDLSALNQVTKAIGSVLNKGDIVMLRSTVPVGTTRKIVIPQLERLSGLIVGESFNVAFAPERTIIGNAMQELRTLPQIVGGLTENCKQKAAQFWTTMTSTIVQVDSLEAAELVKLANNTFRDLSFAFANELAMHCDEYNIDAFKIIMAANEGYTRNPIALPSPGVGGYCLTKDPILLGYTATGPNPKAILGAVGRSINEKAALYPIEIVKCYSAKIGKRLSDFSVLIVGVAFKGVPDTTDVRGSVTIDVAGALRGLVARIVAWDAVVPHGIIKSLGMETADSLDEAIEEADAVLILNNHPDNIDSEAYITSTKRRLIFDGWHQFIAAEIEKIPLQSYATMGYLSVSEIEKAN